MKKMSNLWIAFCLLVAVATCLTVFTGCGENRGGEEMEEENDKYDGPDKAIEFEIERTKDLTTGKVPWGKLWEAMQQTEQSKGSSNLIAALSWIERGPDGDFTVGGNPRPTGEQTAGRIRASMIDSLDPSHNTVWVAGVDGGVWKTTNINASPANWTLVNDFLANLAVSAICQDPRPGFQNNMYFCTGESFSNADAVRGIGVFKSTDAGATWNLLPSSTSFINGTRILCDYQGNIYLGTRNTGLVRSTDGGATWTTITPAGIGTSVSDLEISSTSGPARLHVATGIFSASGYSYTDIPSTVTSGSGWTAPITPFTTFSQRTELGISGNVLYACPDNGSHQVPTIWKTTDGGANWTPTPTQPSTTWAAGQGWYSISCGINPSNSNECIVGGLDTWKTTNSGASWSQLSSWATSTFGFYVHADQHNIQWWDGGTKLMFNCDGGVYYSTNGGTVNHDRNKGLRLKQFYSIAIHPTKTNYFLAGAQDNGMHRMDHPGLDSSIECVGGDGCYSAIDQTNGNFQFGSYVYNVYRRSTNGGANWTTPVNNQSTGRFVNPWDYDNTNFKIYACNNAGTFLRWNDPKTGASTDVVTSSAFASGNVSAVHVSPYTANRVYFGTGTGGIIQIDNADVGTSIAGTLINGGSGMPSGYVNCVVTGSDDQHLLACFTNYGVSNIWVTTNGGTNWTAIDGNLPDMPVRWALFHPDSDTKAFIATETGVWETDLINGASTVWSANSTFPNVRTDMIKYRASDRTIAAGTHGRGIWSATVPNATCTPASITSHPSNSTICAGNNTSFTVVAAGTAPLGYQWQVSTTGAGGPWNNITNGGVYSNATTATLNITGALIGMNAYQYRVVVTGNCPPITATSNPAVLTVNTATVITSQPVNSAICAGANTLFSVTATGSSVTYQWQVSTNGGGSYSNLTNVAPYSNVTTATMNITAAPATLDGYLYRAVVSSACAPINSNAALLTVNSGPAITNQPANNAVCAGNAATFTVVATGGGLTYQWQESINGGANWNNLSNGAPYSGVLTPTLTINPTTVGMNTYQYRVIVTGACPSPVTSNAAILTVGTTLIITSQPASQIVCAGATTSFSVTINGTVISYQWQESINGGANWNNITNGGVYSGATTSTLTLTGVTAGMNTYQYRVVVTGSCPAINSNAAILTVNTAPAITSQPANSTICGGNTSFSVAANGTNITYQWQVNTAGCTGGTWVNLTNAAPYSGVTTPTLTITNAPGTINGYGYRVVVSGTCAPAATSNCALLTVNTAVNITSQPAASTICAGAQTSFTVGATGTIPGYQWQESINGGGNWNNITNGGVYSGATTATLTLTGVTAGMTGYQYRVIVGGAAPCASATSNAATLTVNTAPVITTQPVASTTLCVGGNTTYTVAASGTAVGYQWQVSTTGAGGPWTNIANGGVYSGATTASLTITGATALMNTNQYRAVATGTCAPPANSNATLLTINTPITITTQPAANTNICATGAVSFTTAVTGTSPTYQWQLSTDGGANWNNITNGGVYSGATTNTLTLTAITAAMNGYRYRTVITGTAPCGSVTSNSAILNVTPQPVISASLTALVAGQQAVLTVNVAPAPGLSFAWYLNGILIPGATGNSIIADVNRLGSYRVDVTSATGTCQSQLLDITAAPSTRLFIFPSPNDGRFAISYYSPGASNNNKTSQNITIYDSQGRTVLNRKYDVTQPYQLHQIDMRSNGSGVYYVVLREANGNKIKTGEVVVR